MATVDRLARWMRERLHAAGARGFVIGLSGGIDSAVVARLAQMAAPNGTLGLLLPCYSDPKDEEDALLFATRFSIATERIDLATTYDAMTSAVHAISQQSRAPDAVLPGAANPDIRARVPLANVKPRLRMTA